MDTAEEVRMNLASLQRIDPYIIRIKESASQVALYKYSSTQEWEKTETEGTLFVYERKCEPTYGFLILNRLSTNNWIQPISSEIDSQLQAPFLLYKTKDDDITMLEFDEDEICERIFTAIDKIRESICKDKNESCNVSTESNFENIDEEINNCEEPKSRSCSSPKIETTNSMKDNKSSDDIYTEEDIKIMTGEKSPVPERKDPMVTPSTGSVAQFFAQAQAQQEQEDVSAEDKKPELDMKNRSGIEPSVNMIHPPGAVVTGGPPGIRLPNPVPNAPIQGIVPMVPGVPGMALLPQQPGAPPIMVPIIPSTGAHLMAQQQQIRMAVAHAQAAAAAQTARAQHGHLPAAIHGIIPNVDNSVSDELMNNQHEANSPQLPALQTLLSNPAVMSVESLERAHREESKTPPSNQRNVTGSNEMPPIPSKATSATELESDLKNKLNISKSENLRQKNMDNHSYAGAAKSPNKRTQKEEIKIEKSVSTTAVGSSIDRCNINESIWSSNSSMKNELKKPLTKDQLSQAIKHLLRTDRTFVVKLHNAYAESLKCKTNEQKMYSYQHE